LFVRLQFERAVKKKENRLPCEYRRARKLIGGLLVLPSLWKETDKLLID